MAADAVPVVDLEPFRVADLAGEPLPASAIATARIWRAAFEKYGIAQVVGHGVPDDVIEEAYKAARAFYSLPPGEKAKCDKGLGYGAGGYNGQGVERVSATVSKPDGSALVGAENARPPDLVESMVMKRRPDDVFPDAVPGFRAATDRYYDELVRLLRTMMRITACSFDLPLDTFEPHFFPEDGSPGGGLGGCVGNLSLRLAYYPARPADGPKPGQLRYGEHTDYTGYTILWQDHNVSGPQTAREGLVPPLGGLQAMMPDGSWADCPPVPGAFTVNSGDLIQVWTNDMYQSCLHRVLNPPEGDATDRISMAFFTGPSDETVVRCLPTCCSADRPERYGPITAREHLQRKLAASNK